MAGCSVDAFRHFQLAEMVEDDGLAVMLYRQLYECIRTLIGYLAQTWLPHMTFRVPRTGISRSAYFRPAAPRKILQFG